ncbi:antibiotic biosynthesis monooxygenase family protein [Pseudomonas viridiflava]|uniref:antibiotic biosynthesis monooxygenase family protein n=1 Tax=Pseudomonas viridiflava TaxID=33069 RepID=UPI000F0606A4|nr:antibiotic biosynthesis monooxygenase family protein [Pseudomonas viridiflava]
MTIAAVNTLEIRINPEADPHLEQQLKSLVARIEDMPDCLGYALIRNPGQDDFWILSGYWSNAEAMTAHFSSEPMTGIVSSLIESCANLTFSSFAPVLAEAQCDEV